MKFIIEMNEEDYGVKAIFYNVVSQYEEFSNREKIMKIAEYLMQLYYYDPHEQIKLVNLAKYVCENVSVENMNTSNFENILDSFYTSKYFCLISNYKDNLDLDIRFTYKYETFQKKAFEAFMFQMALSKGYTSIKKIESIIRIAKKVFKANKYFLKDYLIEFADLICTKHNAIRASEIPSKYVNSQLDYIIKAKNIYTSLTRKRGRTSFFLEKVLKNYFVIMFM